LFHFLKKKQKINFSTVIHFSSLDAIFMDHCIAGVIPASNKIAIVSYDKLFNGEDISDTVKKVISRNKNEKIASKIMPLPENKGTANNRYYHNLLRLKGWELVADTADYTLFIDGDEVADPELLLNWKSNYKTKAHSIRLPCYFYFREPIYRSTTLEYTPLMVNNKKFKEIHEKNPDYLIHNNKERNAYNFKPKEIIKDVFFHHYSWVRNKQDMLKKVKNWGHRTQRDWTKLVEEEFTHDFNGTDFVHGYQYETVENKFNISV